MPIITADASEDTEVRIEKSGAPGCSSIKIAAHGGQSIQVPSEIFKTAPLLSRALKFYVVKGKQKSRPKRWTIPLFMCKEIIFIIDSSFKLTIKIVSLSVLDRVLRLCGLGFLQKLNKKKKRIQPPNPDQYMAENSVSEAPDSNKCHLKPMYTDQYTAEDLVPDAPDIEPTNPVQFKEENWVIDAPDIEPTDPVLNMVDYWFPDAPDIERTNPYQYMVDIYNQYHNAPDIEGENTGYCFSESSSFTSFSSSYHSCKSVSPTKDAPNENAHEVSAESVEWQLFKNVMGALN